MSEPAVAPAVEDVGSVKARVAGALRGVRCVVPVMSGKGGVGKSAVAVNLGVALSQRGQRVGILDADLHGPSVAKMLGLRGQPVRLGGDEQLRPAPGPAGLSIQSLDFFLEGNQAPDWDGPDAEGAALRSAMEEAVITDLLGRTRWGDLDTLVIDLPPGADRLPALMRWLAPASPASPGPEVAALAVTIPSQVSLLAVERSLRRALVAGAPLLGLVENFAAVPCPDCGGEAPLFPDGDPGRLAAELGLECLARIPFDPELARAADAGDVYLGGPGRAAPAGVAFAGLAERVAKQQSPAMTGSRT